MADINFNKKIITESFDGIADFDTADFDNDGDRDVLGTSFSEDKISWWQNDNGDGNSWTENSSIENSEEIFENYASDIDGDGNTDIVSASGSDSEIIWWSNVLGEGNSWKKNTFELGVNSDNNVLANVYAEDFDNDGDTDILGGDSNNLYLFDNPNDGSSDWSYTTISRSDISTYNYISVGYINDDQYLDIVSGSSDTVSWWENNNGDFSAAQAIEISPTNNTLGLEVKDIDGDNKSDVLGLNNSTGQIVWWQNNGDGTVWTENIVADYYATDVYAEDLDNDGDTDVLDASVGTNQITWWENTEVNGSVTWTEHTVGSLTNVRDVYTDDFDNDGDYDILGASSSANQIAWWQNSRNIKEGNSLSYDLGSALNTEIIFTIASDLAEVGIDYTVKDSEGTTLTGEASGEYTFTPTDGNSSIVIEINDEYVYDPLESFTITFNNYTFDDGANSFEHTIVESAPPQVRITDYTPTIYETHVDFGDTASFDGVDDYIELGNVLPDDYTKEAWIKRSSGSNDIHIISGGGANTHAFWVSAEQGFKLSAGHNDQYTAVQDSEALAEDVWYHVAVTYDGSDEMKLYKNGELVDSATGVENLSAVSANIGRDNDGNYFVGEMDEVRIWHEVRTQEEIQDNLYSALEGTEANLIHYYSFDEGTTSGDTIPNLGEGLQNATFINGDGYNFDSSFSFVGHIDLELNSEVTNQPGITVNYQLDSDTTATQDEDFYNSQTDVSTTDGVPQTDSIFIPEGEDSARIYLTALPDALAEENEAINLTILPDFNQAFDPNGTDDYVDTNAELVELAQADFTLEAWIKTTGTRESIIVKNNGDSSWNSGEKAFYLDDSGQVSFVGFGNNYIKGNTAVNDGQWHHVAVVWDYDSNSSGAGTIYVDGEDDTNTSTTNYAANNSDNNGDTYKIGLPNRYDNKEASNFFSGEIDEVRIWDTARTAAEIEEYRYASLDSDETNLAAYYNFNQNAVNGKMIADITTNSNDGTLVTNNKVLSLDSSNSSHVDMGSSLLNNLTEFTIEGWFNANSIQRYDLWGQNDSVEIFLDNNGDLRVWTSATNGETFTDLNLTANEWYHVAAVGSNNGVEVYLNGSSIGSIDGTVSSYGNSSDTTKIGGEVASSSGGYFDGEIDDVRIWNVARSEDEIQSHFDTRLDASSETGLIAYYTFDDDTASDQSGNGNDGSLINSANTVVDDSIPVSSLLTDSVAYDPFAISGATYGIQTTQSAAITLEDTNHYVVDAIIANVFGDDLSEDDNYILPNAEGNYTFKVKLASEPTDDVTVGFNDTTNLTPTNYTFTSENWDTYQEFTLTSVEELTLTFAGGDYEGETRTISAIENDGVVRLKVTEGGTELEITPTVTFSADQSVIEGTAAPGVFTIFLDTPAPEGGLEIPFTVTSTDSAVEGTNFNVYPETTDDGSTSQRVVTIAEGEMSGSITVAKIDNDIVETNTESVTVSLSAGDNYVLNNHTDSINLVDDDAEDLEIARLETVGSLDDSEIESLVTLELRSLGETDTGATASFGVSLVQEPTEDVTVTLTDANGTSSGEVTLTTDNWDTPQSVPLTLDSSNDSLELTVNTTSNQTEYSNGNFSVPIITETVATSLDYVGNLLATYETDSAQGNSTSFAIRLNTQPTSDVTVTLSIPDTAAEEGELIDADTQAGSPTVTLNFNADNWDSYQEVNLTGLDDSEVDGDIEYSIEVDSSNYSNTNDLIPVINYDDDVETIEVVDFSNDSSIIASLEVVDDELAEEGGTSADTLQINLSEPAPTDDFTVRYTVSGGTAIPGEDFVDLGGFVDRLDENNALSESQTSLTPNSGDSLRDFKLADLNNDGDLDAVIIGGYNLETVSAKYLENTGDSSLASFVEHTASDNPFDALDIRAIAFGDFNDDGYADGMFADSSGVTYYLENISNDSDSSISFADPVSTGLSISSTGVPTLVDIDNDADLELFVGEADGTISYYEYAADTTSSLGFSLTLNDNGNPLAGFDVGENAVPNFTDYDRDGDLDVFIGDRDGIKYYENIGSGNEAIFVERTGSDNPVDGVVVTNSNYPALVDINHDDDLDLFNADAASQNIAFYENLFYQEVTIPKGEQTATVDLTTIDDAIAEENETIEVALSAKPSPTYTLVVTEAYANGTVGLQINDSETEALGIASGSVLKFGNGAELTITEDVDLFSGTPAQVRGTLSNGTSIAVNETTDFTDEGYRQSANIAAVGNLTEDSNGQQTITLRLDEANVSSLTLKEGTVLSFSNGAVVAVTSETAIDNSTTGTSVAIELSGDSVDSISSGETSTVEDVSFNTSGAGKTSPNNTITIVDDEVAGITFAGDTDGTTTITTSESEAGTATNSFSVVLDTEPTGDVAVYLGSSNSEEGLLSDENEEMGESVKLVFTPNNWDKPQDVSITPVDEEIQDDDTSYEIITTVVSDDIVYQEDVVSLEVATDFEISDRQTKSVNLAIDDLNINSTTLPKGTQLTFSNGAVFTVNQDADLSNSVATPVALDLDLSASQIDAETTATLTGTFYNEGTDQEDPVSFEVIVVEPYDGATGTISIKPMNITEAQSVDFGSTLTFSNGAVGTIDRFINIEPNETEEINVELLSYTVTTEETTQFEESITSNIIVTNTDDDLAGATVTASEYATEEGHSNNFFTVGLDSEPEGEVEVTMSPVDANGDKDYNLQLENEFEGESSTITFDETNWDVEQTVKVTAVDDSDVEYNHESFITFDIASEADANYNSATNSELTTPEDVVVKIEDNDLPIASIEAIAGAAEASSPGYFVVKLDDAAPDGFDGTGIVVNYTIDTNNATVDLDSTDGNTDDLKPIGEYDVATNTITGSVRIAPGETRSPLIAFPIDDFIAEGVDLKYAGSSDFAIDKSDVSQTISLIINDSETDEFTIPSGTELSFADGVVLTVQNNVTLVAQTAADVTVSLLDEVNVDDSAAIAPDSLTTIEGESVSVFLDTGDEYKLSDAVAASAIVQDNDKPGIRIVEIEDPMVVNEDGTTTTEFYVSLLSQPETDVTIDLSGVSTTQNLIVDSVDDSSTTDVYLKLANDASVSSLLLKAGTYDIGSNTVTVASDTFINDEAVLVALNSNSNVKTGDILAYSYDELDLENGSEELTFTSDNWYELQTVNVKGIDDNVVETGDYHTSAIEYSITDDSDSTYTDLEIAPQTINIIDRTFDPEQTAESFSEGFLALQDSIDNVTLPIVGSLSDVSPSFLKDFLDNLVEQVKATDELTAESLSEAFNTSFNHALGESDFSSDLATPEFAITNLSSDNIEFSLGITGTVDESIALDGDLGLPALGIAIESDGSLDLGFEYALELAFGINQEDGLYINTEDTSFGVGAGMELSEDFVATGNLGFLQLDIINAIDPDNGDNDGTGIDLEFVATMKDADTAGETEEEQTQLTLSELNSLRQSDNLFDSIEYGFNGDAALDLDLATTVEGDAAFPSFGLNISSDLPLFNYSNSEDAEELDEAQVVVNSAVSNLSTTSDSTISLTIQDRDDDNGNNSLINLNQGTELSFYTGDNDNQTEYASVILQEKVIIEEGSDEAKLVDVRLAKDSTSKTTIADNATADLVSGDFNISFNDITLDFGTFVTDLISPVITYVNDLIEPFEPIIDVLQTEVELLDTLGMVSDFDENGDGEASLIEVASILATTFGSQENSLKYAQFFDAVSGIIDLVDTLNTIEGDLADPESTFNVDFGSYTLQSFGAASGDESESADEYNADNGTSNLNSDIESDAITSTANDSSKVQELKTKVSGLFTKLNDLGISIPLVEEPLTAIELFLGQDVDLFTYDIPELDIEFGIEQEFPIPGVPAIEGLLEGSFSIYADLLVGYDTNGLSQWEATDFTLADSYKVFDGFYLSDLDPDTEEDIDELTMDATIAAGLSASAVIAKAEVKGGLTGTAALDIVDGGEYTGDSDGKLRGSEILDADSLFDLFTLSGSLEAFLEAVVKVGVDLGFFEVMKTVWSEEFSTTLFEFELNSSGGTVSQYYVEGATVYFDSNFNGELDEGEPSDVTDAAGKYNLDVPLLFFDTNDNGVIDAEEGRIVSIDGIDTSTNLTVETPLVAPYGNQMITPLTTLKQYLIEEGTTEADAETQIKLALGLPDVDLDKFDPFKAIAEGNSDGVEIYQAHNKLQSLFIQVTQFVEELDSNSLDTDQTLEQQVLKEIAKGLVKPGKEVDLSSQSDLETILETLETKITVESDQTYNSFTQIIAFGSQELDEAFTNAKSVETTVEDVAAVKQFIHGQLGYIQRQLASGAISLEDVDTLLTQADQVLAQEAPYESLAGLPVLPTEEEKIIVDDPQNIVGTNSDDTLNGGTGQDTIRGTDGDDNLSGDDGDDWLYGDGGNDIIAGNDNDDYLLGGIDNDNIEGGAGNDYLLGQAGLDTLNGGTGNDTLLGGEGNDLLNGGADSDLLNDTAGNNVFVLSSGDTNNVIFGYQDGSDKLGLELSSFAGDNLNSAFDELTITQSSENSAIAEIYANSGSDLLASLINVNADDLTVDDFTSVV